MKKSCILEYIKTYPDTWEKDITDKGILVKREGPLAIFNYSSLGCDFFDQIVKEARGIILDLEKMEAVCWPFNKFGNWQEAYADKIDWSSAKVQEKLDGSIMKLWFDNRQGNWRWSTNGVINADEAEFEGTNFGRLVRSASNYKNINFDSLNRDHTYIFELVSPSGHVIHYPTVRLWLIGERDLISGEEVEPHIEGIQRPKQYDLDNFDACIRVLASLNDSDNVEHEGFVVVDKDYHRIKMKTEEYLLHHHYNMNHNISPSACIEILMSEDKTLYDGVCEVLANKRKVKYYDYKLAELEYEVQQAIDFARTYYEEMGGDRAVLAKEIQRNPYKSFCFSAIGNDLTAIQLIKKCTTKKILNFIEKI